jgi:hypothetical protein
MSEFVDRLLVQLSDSPRLLELVVPPSDAGHSRVRALLDAAYDLAFATIHEVRDVRVVAKELQWPLFAPVRMSGTWTQTIPNYGRTDVAYERSGELRPCGSTCQLILKLSWSWTWTWRRSNRS